MNKASKISHKEFSDLDVDKSCLKVLVSDPYDSRETELDTKDRVDFPATEPCHHISVTGYC